MTTNFTIRELVSMYILQARLNSKLLELMMSLLLVGRRVQAW